MKYGKAKAKQSLALIHNAKARHGKVWLRYAKVWLGTAEYCDAEQRQRMTLSRIAKAYQGATRRCTDKRGQGKGKVTGSVASRSKGKAMQRAI